MKSFLKLRFQTLKITFFELGIIWIILFLYCGGPKQTLVSSPPVQNGTAVIGGILIEFNGFNSQFDTFTLPVEVILIGKIQSGRNEQFITVSAMTDKNGYFILERVPRGSYLLKEIRIPFLNSVPPLQIVSNWETPDPYFFIPQLSESPQTISKFSFLPEPEEEIVDLGIYTFSIQKMGTVISGHFQQLNNLRLVVGTYTRISPLHYFKRKLQNSSIF